MVIVFCYRISSSSGVLLRECDQVRLICSFLSVVLNAARRSFDSETKFYLRPGDYLVLGLISAGEHCLGVLALTYTSISIGNYLFLFQVHFLFQLILSAIFLRRKPTLLQSFATLLILGAIAVFVLIQYNGMGSTAVELLPSL